MNTKEQLEQFRKIGENVLKMQQEFHETALNMSDQKGQGFLVFFVGDEGANKIGYVGDSDKLYEVIATMTVKMRLDPMLLADALVDAVAADVNPHPDSINIQKRKPFTNQN